MTPSLLRRCTLAYSRDAGTTGIALALGVNGSTVRRWLSGYTPVPDWLPNELSAIMVQRAAELRQQADECEACVKHQLEHLTPD